MNTKHINNNSDNLIVFLTGWGCDDNQFEFMKNSDNFDILICFNYTTPDFSFDFSKYKKFYLICFSAGVFMISFLKDKLPVFEKTIAINGNPLAYNEYFGLRKEIIKIFYGVTKETAFDFRRKYLVYDDEEFKKFNKTQSLRTFKDSKEELISLKKYSLVNAEPYKFDVSILSMDDKIFIPERQIEYWDKKSRCIKLENAAHFPFFILDDYKKIIEI